MLFLISYGLIISIDIFNDVIISIVMLYTIAIKYNYFH